MSVMSRRRGRFTGAVVAGMALLLVHAGFSSAQAAAVDPEPVTNLRVVTDPVSPPDELTVAWDASPSDNVTEYRVEVLNYDGPDYLGYVKVDAELTYTAFNLNPGQAVKVTVTALSFEDNDEGYSTPVSIIANPLGDVNEDGTFFDTVGNTFEYEIAWLATTGITTGYPDGNFRPAAPVLREQMAAFIFRLGNFNEDYEAPAESLFTDVATTDTFYREISWLAEEGISTGYANGDGTRSFGPSQPVLREQMAAFIYRAFGFDYDHGLDPASFVDTPRSSTFFDEIEFMALVNITTGYKEANGTLTFRGSQPVLREQMAAFLYRAVGVQYSTAIGPRLIPGETATQSEDAPAG